MARIENQENNTIVYGTDSADDLFNAKINVKIFGYDGNDTIENRGYEVIIEAGDGNDSIYSDVYPEYGDDNYRRATIYGGAGKDTVLVNDNETSLNAGADNDFISIFGNDRWENNTLQGGLGNDTIYGGKSNVIIYEEGDGFDTIFCGTSCDTIQIASNNDYISTHNGDDIIIRVGNGSMLLKNPSDIIITKAPNILNGTENSDKISNDSSYKTISTDSGDDVIYNTGGRGTKLNGGADNDFIYNGGSVENFFTANKNTLAKINDISNVIRDSYTQTINDANSYYNSTKNEIKSLSDDATNLLDNIFNILESVKGSVDIADKIDNVIDLIDKNDRLNTINRTFDNERYSRAVSQYISDYFSYVSTNPPPTVSEKRTWLSTNRPNRSSYIIYESNLDKIIRLRSSGTLPSEKIKGIDKLIGTDAFDSQSGKFKPLGALKNSSKLAKASVGLTVLDFALNLIENKDEIANALDEAQSASLFDKWHEFQESFKANAGEKDYDEFNLSAIDVGMTAVEIGLGGLATVALVTAGLPVLATSLEIGALFYVGNAAIKTGYSTSQHSDANGLKTFLKNLNPLDFLFNKDGSTYIQKSLVMSYTLNLAADEISIEIITIIGGTGNDTLLNDRSNNVIIDSGTGDDIIVNQESENVTIAAGEGNDTITNINSSNVTISGNTGNDFISSNSDSITIDAGDGNNSIINYMGSYISISAGKDNDYIDNIGNDVTIDVGNGTNTVSNIGARASLKTGIGDDEISLIGAAGNINADSGHDLIYNHGNRNTIDTGADNDSVNNNDGSNLSIMTGTGQDYIESFGDSNTINSGEDNDVINNIGNLSSVNADLGDDYIENFGDSNTVNSGEGSDYILNVGNKNFISSGIDDDIIEIFGEFNTIIAGAGDDFINLGESSNVIEYTETEGTDIIEGFDITSSLNISGNSYSTQENGSDIIVVVGNSSISLIGAATLSTLHIDGTLEPDTTPDNQKIITLTKSNDTHHNTTSGVSINALGGNDNILNGEINTSSGKDVSIFGEAGDDTIYNHAKNVTINGGAGNDSIHNTADNVTIDGGAGNDTIYHRFGRNVLIYGGDGDDSIDNPLDKVTIDGGAGDDTIRNTDENVSLVGGEGNDTIINVVVYYGGTLPTYSNHITVNGGKGNDLISLAGNDNKSSMNAIQYTVGDGNDIIYGFNESDTLTITGGSYSSTKSGNDVIVTVGENNITLIGAASLAGININNDTDFPKIIVTDGADNIVNTISGITITALGGNDTIYTEGANITISGGDGNDYIDNGSTSTNGGSNVLINGGNGNDTIGSYFADSATMNGEDGDDYLYNHYSNKSELNGGKGKDSLIGGNGSDIFTYENKSGNKVIQNYSSSDTISLIGAQISDASIKSNDIILKVGSKKITVKGAASQEITISEDDTTKFFVDNILYDEDKTSAILSPKFSAKTEKVFDSTVSYIDASKAKKKLILTSDYSGSSTILGGKKNDSLTGNSGNDILYGSKGNDSLYGSSGNDTLWGEAGKDKLYGGDGNNTLIGGKGNDSLWGGNDTDTFIYSKGDGKDIIYGFDNTDILQITDTFSTTYNNSKSEIYFKVGSTKNAITLKNFKATDFNINNDSYQISGSSLVKK